MHGATPGEAHADGGDLAGFVGADADPHAGVVGQTVGARQADVGQHVDDQLLDRAHVRDRVRHGRDRAAPLGAAGALVGEVEQRVAHQLAGAVVGDVAAAVRAHELGADRGRVDQEVVELTSPAEGEHVGVLEQQEVIVRGALEEAVLEGVGVLVADGAQPAGAQGHGAAGDAAPPELTARRPSRGSG